MCFCVSLFLLNVNDCCAKIGVIDILTVLSANVTDKYIIISISLHFFFGFLICLFSIVHCYLMLCYGQDVELVTQRLWVRLPAVLLTDITVVKLFTQMCPVTS